MNCSYCNEPITTDSIKQGGENFCSLECANLSAGYETDSDDGYFDEDYLLTDDYNLYEE